ncbi:MAG: hypothetical protein ACKO04_03765 [Actinomycetes bacterium]
MEPGPDDHPTRSPAALQRLAVLTAVGSVVALLALWYVFIRTNDGRRFENFVWDSRRVMAPGCAGRTTAPSTW